MFDKPFLTYDKQITRLTEDYGLIIQDRNMAKKLLSSLSYYDLINGYKECFMENNQYTEHMTIEKLYRFLAFDRTFQSILLKYSIYVENRFKNILAYEISSSYGVDMPDYLNSSNYKTTTRASRVLQNLNQIPEGRAVLNPTKHYKDTKNHIPAWILLRNATFNDSIDLFSILENDHYFAVCESLFSSFESLDTDYRNEFAKNSLIIVRQFRNKIAHNLKFVTFRTKKNTQIILKNLSSTFSGSLIERDDFKLKRGMRDPYAMILSLTTLLNEDFLIVSFFEDLSRAILVLTDGPDGFGKDIFDKYCGITNIPPNIINRFNHYIYNNG